MPCLRSLLVATVCAACVSSAQTNVRVYLEFFYNPNCDHCRAPLDTLMRVQQQYAPCVTVLIHHVVTVAQYRELMAMEDALGVGRREPVAVYAGTNCLYGAADIAAHLETLITNAIAHGGARPWRPTPAAAVFATAAHATNQPSAAAPAMPRAVAYVGFAVGGGVAALAIIILALRPRRHMP